MNEIQPNLKKPSSIACLQESALVFRPGLALLRDLFRFAQVPTIALIIVVLFAASGCKQSLRRDVGAGASNEKSIAMVNNEPIALEGFMDAYQLFLTRWDRFIKNDPTKKQEIKELVLSEMIDEKLLDQEVRRRGIKIEEAEIQKQVARLTAPWTSSDIQEVAKRSNQDFASWRESLVRRLSHEKLIQQEVVSRIRITKRELRAHFERNKKDFVQPEQVRVRHIAVGSTADYKRVQRRIKQGQDFLELVKKYSITPDRENGGDLGFVERGVLPVEFDQAIFAMKSIGSVSSANKPVKSQIGYHIFRLEGRKPKTNLSFEAAVPKIREILISERQPEEFKKWIQHLRERATIKIDQKLLEANLG